MLLNKIFSTNNLQRPKRKGGERDLKSSKSFRAEQTVYSVAGVEETATTAAVAVITELI